MAASPANVVLIPGFGGTTLYYAGGRGGKTNYWYNPRALLSNNPLTGALASNGSAPYAVLGKQLYPNGPVDLGVYEPMLTALANGGYNAVFWGYDWRLTPLTNATLLVNFLASSAVASSFQIVCHSFGGLIAQLSYPPWLNAATGKTWKQTVYCGTPHGGSYWAAAALAGWFPDGSELAVFAPLFKLEPPAAHNIKGLIVSALEEALANLIGSWPGIYTLLPNPLGSWASLDPNAAELTAQATYNNTWGGTQSQWFTLANTTFASLVANLTTPRPKETCIVGTGRLTLGGYKSDSVPVSNVKAYSSVDGDGTVTTARATLPSFAVTVQLPGICHNALMTSGNGTAAVLAAIANPPAQSTIDPFTFAPQVPLPSPPLPVNLPTVVNPFANIKNDP